jgi:uncharacterized membrane protein YccC
MHPCVCPSVPDATDLVYTARRMVLDVEHAEALAQRITGVAVSLYDPQDEQRRHLALRVEEVAEGFLGLLEDPLLALGEQLQGTALWSGPLEAIRRTGEGLLELGETMVRQAERLEEVAEEVRGVRPNLRDPVRALSEVSSELKGHGVSLSAIGERLRTLEAAEAAGLQAGLRSGSSTARPTPRDAGDPGQRPSSGT